MSILPQNNLAEELRRDTREVIEGVAALLAGKVYSPRIKLLSIAQVCEATGLAPRTIHGKVKDGTFPRPLDGLGKNLWRESTLIAWMNARDPDAERDWSKRAKGEN